MTIARRPIASIEQVDGLQGALIAPARYAPPLSGVAVSPIGSTPAVIDYFPDEGVLWGVTGGVNVYSSADFGDTWQAAYTSPFSVIALKRCSDGELLALCGAIGGDGGLWKSSGIATPATATWSRVAAPTSGGGYYLPWGFDGDGTKFIVCEYANSPNWQFSRRVWVSLDSGDTFAEVYDFGTEHADDNANTHLHAACYDPWDDRFWFSNGHSTYRGCYYSDDDGLTWTRITPSWAAVDAVNGPTVMVATDNGIVCGSDSDFNGVYVIPRVDDPSHLTLEWVWNWIDGGAAGLIGYADRGYRDPNTGMVYIGFLSNRNSSATYDAVRPMIAASDGIVAGVVWHSDDATMARVNSVFVADNRVVAMLYDKSAAKHKLTGRAQNPGSYSNHRALTDGRIISGAAKGSSLAIGALSSTGDAVLSIAVGKSASAQVSQFGSALGAVASVTGESGTATGYSATASVRGTATGATANAGVHGSAHGYYARTTGTGGVANGYNASTATGVAAGYNATADFGGTAIGNGAQAASTQGVAVGNAAKAMNIFTTALGQNANAAVNYGTAIGNGAAVTAGTYGTAIGQAASVAHTSAVALGDRTASSAASQVNIGARHIEAANVTTPAAGAAGTGRIAFRDSGGVQELVVVFANGTVKVLANDVA